MTENKTNKNDARTNRLQEVFEDWGNYMDFKKAKLEEQYKEEAANDFKEASSLFKGIAIFVNGYTNPPSDELRRLMMAHGGIFHHYLRTGITTHMIATNLPYSKIMMYKKAQNPLPLCKPEWITDSIKAGKVLDFRNYLLYSQHTKTQPKLANIFNRQKISNQSREDKSAVESASNTIHKNNTIDNKKSTVTTTTQRAVNETIEVSDFKSIIDKPQSTIIEEKIELNFNKKDCKEKMSNNENYKNVTVDVQSTLIEKKLTANVTTNKYEKGVKNKENASSVLACKETNNDVVSNKPISATERNCTKNSEFLTDFYNNSRLHHIATMGAMFKDYINDLRDKSTGDFPGLQKLCVHRNINKAGPSNKNDFDSDEDIFESYELKSRKENIIMHIDMDCFFVSVGLRKHPELRGFPIAVAHAKGNKITKCGDEELGSMSEIASCSYEARKAGVKNGMFLGQALKLCPNLKTIRYDFEGYKEVSYALYDSVASYTLQIEAVSCDEMYVDCSEILQKSGLDVMTFADILRREIKEKTDCPVSTGFGSNKLQARLATKKAKPDGQFHLKEQDVKSYVGTLTVKDLPGVGYSTAAKLKQMGVNNCSDLQTISVFNLQKEFGKKTGELLYNMCRGVDNSKLNLEHVRKSVSAEVNYGIRFENQEDATQFLEKLSSEVCSRLKKVHAAGRNITLKLMVRAKEAPKETAKFMGHGLCDYLTKTKTLMTAVNDNSVITKEVMSLWHQMQQVPEEIRGIGIQISRLESTKNKTITSSTLLNFISKAKEVPKVTLPLTSTNPFEQQSTSSNVHIVHEYKKSSVEMDSKVASTVELNSQKSNSGSQTKVIQTKPEDYFKKTKPSMNRSAKVELPSLQEIDMAVLVELPENIRNEILNEYKLKNNLQPSTSREETVEEQAKPEKALANKHLQRVCELQEKNELDISFSQVDPEFLAALSEDIRNEVKMYCDMKKKEKEINTKKDNVPVWNVFQRDTKTKVKRKRKLDKIVNSKANTIGNKKAKITNDETEKRDNKISTKQCINIKAGVSQNKSSDNDKNKKDCMIIFENNKFSINDSKVEENKEILITLVNCMLDLPVDQVKSQIQAWISNSEAINEIDFLSIATYLGMLPKRKRIEDLHILLKTMHRCVTKLRNCVWHETYKKIAEHIQHNMQLEYNSDLMLPPMGCNRCTR